MMCFPEKKILWHNLACDAISHLGSSIHPSMFDRWECRNGIHPFIQHRYRDGDRQADRVHGGVQAGDATKEESSELRLTGDAWAPPT